MLCSGVCLFISSGQEDGYQRLGIPAGLLRVYLEQGKDIGISDRGVLQLLGKKGGSSDPYCILTVQGHSTCSPVVKKSLNPVWNTYFQFPVMEPGPRHCELQVNLMDYDMVGVGSTHFSSSYND